MALEDLVYLMLHVMLLAFLSFIGAFVLQFATKSLCEFEPPYEIVFKACFILSIIAAIIPFVLGAVFQGIRPRIVDKAMVLWILLSFSTFTVFLGFKLKHPEFGSIGIKKGAILGLILMTTLLLLYKIIAPLMISSMGDFEDFLRSL
ncbi:MAG: hypothetical protein H0Z19_11495 [Archaeoglobus sp.]|uniref:hypothetical protein n=1 Tax=Archaeoglobus sp. TaxID=1872626 RepID=UPI001DC71E9D|nr:hypothetical protein [Archaeoglobus sp.]MBO8181072.1 hypothetical protein [Archaeoglobus sp.]